MHSSWDLLTGISFQVFGTQTSLLRSSFINLNVSQTAPLHFMSKIELIVFLSSQSWTFELSFFSPMESLFFLYPWLFVDSNGLRYSECSNNLFFVSNKTFPPPFRPPHSIPKMQIWSWHPLLKTHFAKIKGPFANILHSGKGGKKIGLVSETIFSTANTVQRKQCAKSHQSVCSLMNDLLNKHFMGMGMHKYCLENS